MVPGRIVEGIPAGVRKATGGDMYYDFSRVHQSLGGSARKINSETFRLPRYHARWMGLSSLRHLPDADRHLSRKSHDRDPKATFRNRAAQALVPHDAGTRKPKSELVAVRAKVTAIREL